MKVKLCEYAIAKQAVTEHECDYLRIGPFQVVLQEDGSLEIRSYDDLLSVRPRASNSVFVRNEKR